MNKVKMQLDCSCTHDLSIDQKMPLISSARYAISGQSDNTINLCGQQYYLQMGSLGFVFKLIIIILHKIMLFCIFSH